VSVTPIPPIPPTATKPNPSRTSVAQSMITHVSNVALSFAFIVAVVLLGIRKDIPADAIVGLLGPIGGQAVGAAATQIRGRSTDTGTNVY
jgi:hypothetical protein